MSIRHFKARLERLDADGWYVYRFYPDIYGAAGRSGLYRMHPQTFETEIIEACGAGGPASPDGHCVAATAVKIRKLTEAEGGPPREVFYIA